MSGSYVPQAESIHSSPGSRCRASEGSALGRSRGLPPRREMVEPGRSAVEFAGVRKWDAQAAGQSCDKEHAVEMLRDIVAGPPGHLGLGGGTEDEPISLRVLQETDCQNPHCAGNRGTVVWRPRRSLRLSRDASAWDTSPCEYCRGSECRLLRGDHAAFLPIVLVAIARDGRTSGGRGRAASSTPVSVSSENRLARDLLQLTGLWIVISVPWNGSIQRAEQHGGSVTLNIAISTRLPYRGPGRQS